MRTELSNEAAAFGDVVRSAIASAGGDRLVEQVEADPARRDTVLDAPLAAVGVWDLDVRGDQLELEAAAAACRAVGWWAEPAPVAARLARPADGSADATVVVAGPRVRAPLQASSLRWNGLGLDGRTHALSAVEADPTPVKHSGFVVDVEAIEIGRGTPRDLALAMVLPMWTLLGVFDRVVELTAAYVQERKQFGKPLASFQAVQFQLTEAEVERVGVAELAKHALWSIVTDRPDAVIDALALRVAALEAAEIVLGIGHQLHGAIGFCDETTLSWLSRASQPIRKLPMSRSATLHELTTRMGRTGLSGLYSEVLG